MAAPAANPSKLSRGAKFALMYGDAGGFMSHLSPQARRQVKQFAAKRGLTVEGVLQPGPDALRSRSTGSLRQQAMKTVNAAYAPTEKQLSDRESQVKALDTKRQLDNQFYRDWLTGQESKADAVSQASDAALQSVVNNAGAQIDARYASAKQMLDQQNAATPGNVSDPSQSAAAGSLDQSQVQAVGAANIAQAGAIGQISRSETERAALQASNFAQVAALESKRLGDTYTALSQVASDQHSEKLQKAADVTKEVGRLLDNEVSKANNAQQLSALEDKLGVSKAQLTLATTKEQHTYQLGKSKLREKTATDQANQKIAGEKLTVEQNKQMLADKKYNLDVKKFGQAQAKDNYQKAHGLGPYSKKGTGQSDANLQKLTRQGNAGIIQANAISMQPKYQNNYAKYKAHLLAKGVNIAVINAGWQYSRGGVVGETVRNLRRMGVVVPKGWRQGQ